MVICLEQGANYLHMVLLIPLPPIISCYIKIQNGLPLWCQLTQVVLKKGCKTDVVVVVSIHHVRINRAAKLREEIQYTDKQPWST